jgi:hypothetical protein
MPEQPQSHHGEEGIQTKKKKSANYEAFIPPVPRYICIISPFLNTVHKINFPFRS